jgi:L-threonylcarbamoyladenylate synthase
MEKYWPGPLTIIFEAEDNVPPLLTGGTGKVAARIPGKSAALNLAAALQLPITATSANPSTKPPAEESITVADYFGDCLDLIIDAGRTPGGKPSTIVDATVKPPRILRKGSVLLESI